MTQEEIIEGNKLIAEFMGFTRYYPNMTRESDLSNIYIYGIYDKVFHESLYVTNTTLSCSNGVYKCYNINHSMHLKDMQFNSSWDWIIPVIEKIEKLDDYSIVINYYSCNILDTAKLNITFTSNSKIKAVYNAIIEFIKWYNKNKV